MDNKDRSKYDFLSLNADALSTQKMHQYLLGGIAPRPIAFVSSMDSEAKVNLSPFSFFNVFGANPPVLIFSPARRVRDNTTKHTLDNVYEHSEVVVNMVDYAMVEQMSLASTEYDKGIDEFIKSGLTPIKSDLVKVPRVAESPVSYECKVNHIIETGFEAGAGNLILCEVLAVHVRKDCLDDHNIPDPLKLDLVGRMGGSWYCRTNQASLFEIPKPNSNLGIGVDNLPPSAIISNILTGNNLGRLGNQESVPTQALIDSLKKEIQKTGLLELEPNKLVEELHRKVKIDLESGKMERALGLLWLAQKYSDQ